MSGREKPVGPKAPAAPRTDTYRVLPIPPPFDEVVRLFNAGEFRACVEPLEVLFFADRNTFYQGLLHLVVALLQTRLGMVRGPRIRLASAAGLLEPYRPWHRGVDVDGLLRQIGVYLELLPEQMVTTTPGKLHALGLPSFRLELTPQPSDQECHDTEEA